jgi:hypothetical protein
MRKNLFVLIVVSMALFSVVACKGPESYSRYPLLHVGTWTGVDSTNTKGMVTFREDGTGTMQYGGNAYEFRYVFDYGRRPIWLDLIYSREGRPFRARLIVKYIDENSLKWYTHFSEVRPASFPESDGGNVMKLTRLNSLTKV